jgi:hypothetical protein
MKRDSIASRIIIMMLPIVGLFNRVFVRLPLGKRVISLSNRLTGKTLPSLAFLGYRKGASYETAIHNWENFLDLIGADYEAENISPEERRYTINRCPAGYCRSEHLDACQATMEIDRNLVEISGGRLIVDKRFPTDGICVERVVPI